MVGMILIRVQLVVIDTLGLLFVLFVFLEALQSWRKLSPYSFSAEGFQARLRYSTPSCSVQKVSSFLGRSLGSWCWDLISCIVNIETPMLAKNPLPSHSWWRPHSQWRLSAILLLSRETLPGASAKNRMEILSQQKTCVLCQKHRFSAERAKGGDRLPRMKHFCQEIPVSLPRMEESRISAETVESLPRP